MALAWISTLAAGCGQPIVTGKAPPNRDATANAEGSSGDPQAAENDSGSAIVTATNATSTGTPDAANSGSPDANDSRQVDTNAKPVLAANGNSAGSNSVVTTAAATTSTGGEFVPPKPRRFKVEGPNGAVRITYDDLDVKKLLNLDNVVPGVDEKLPQWVKDLNGKTVRLRGYMKPGFQSEDITQFVFARDTGACCFGPNLRFDYLITVTLAPEKTTPLRDLTPFDVVGTFRIELIQIDDRTFVGPYHIDDAILLNK